MKSQFEDMDEADIPQKSEKQQNVFDGADFILENEVKPILDRTMEIEGKILND